MQHDSLRGLEYIQKMQRDFETDVQHAKMMLIC